MFVGTEYNINLAPRFTEIEEEVRFISERFAEKEQERVQLNTQLIISEVLSGVFNSYKQFEEELECLNRARRLSFKLKENGKRKMYIRILLGLSWAMDSVRNFALFLLMMQLFFMLFYYLFMKDYEQTWVWDFSWNGINTELCVLTRSFISSTKYFFTTETSETFVDVFKKHERLSNIIRGFQGFCSLSSLSIFMAMVYLRISRK